MLEFYLDINYQYHSFSFDCNSKNLNGDMTFIYKNMHLYCVLHVMVLPIQFKAIFSAPLALRISLIHKYQWHFCFFWRWLDLHFSSTCVAMSRGNWKNFALMLHPLPAGRTLFLAAWAVCLQLAARLSGSETSH